MAPSATGPPPLELGNILVAVSPTGLVASVTSLNSICAFRFLCIALLLLQFSYDNVTRELCTARNRPAKAIRLSS